MIRTLLVDDEELARNILRRALADIADIEIIGEASYGVEALEKIAELKPALVLLDIEMPGFNGFEIVQQLQGDPPAVVFITAYDEYAVRAFEANAVDYLLKPVRQERLEPESFLHLDQQVVARRIHVHASVGRAKAKPFSHMRL